jgi:hypothetical protein
LLLLLAHVNNEINVLSKLILMMRKDPPLSLIVDHVEAGQTFIIMRLLIGKLHEAWELFKTRFQSNRPLAEKCIPQLQREGAEALEALNRHFGRGSSLTAIRNKVSFHYTDKDDLTEAAFQQFAESEPLQFYLARTVGNSFYHAAELIVALSAINLTKAEANDQDASLSPEASVFSALCGEIIEVSRHITELFGAIVGMMTEGLSDLGMTFEHVPDGPKLSTFCLPYFFDEVDEWPSSPSDPASK